MGIVDSHCHLTDPRLLRQVDAVVARARSAGVTGIVTVGCGPDDSERAIELADRFDEVWATAAIHPHDAKSFSAEALGRIEQLIGRPKVVAVGEIGLDYHYDFSPRDAQQEAFEAQLRLAGRLDMPVVIHSRESAADTLAIIRRVQTDAGPLRGVFHSFTGTADEARAVLDAGFHVSLSGIVTFKKSLGLQSAARLVPPDRLLVETDAPYLSPEPVRKIKVNEPAHVVHVLACLARLRGDDPAALAARINANVHALFGVEGR